jgi:hypothetical protein
MRQTSEATLTWLFGLRVGRDESHLLTSTNDVHAGRIVAPNAAESVYKN